MICNKCGRGYMEVCKFCLGEEAIEKLAKIKKEMGALDPRRTDILYFRLRRIREIIKGKS